MRKNPNHKGTVRELADTEKSINNLLRAIESGLFTQATKDRMLQLESDRADLKYRIDGEKLNAPTKIDFDMIYYYLTQFANGDPQNPQFRERLIDTFVNKVVLYNDRLIITYNTNNQNPTLDEILYDHETTKRFVSCPIGAR